MHQRGFTLIELLVVIGILAVLLAITLIAINPAKQFQSANDTKRASDVNALLNAINQYMADNRGSLPSGIDATERVLCGPIDPVTCPAATSVDICTVLVPDYIAALPVDPLTNNGTPVQEADCGSAYDTQYTVQSGNSNRLTVSAPDAEGANPIEVTR